MAIFDAIAAKGNDSDVSPAKMVELFERAAIGLSEDPGEKVPFRAAGKSTAASMDELLAQFDIKTHGGEVMACNPVGKEKYE
ncbi:hypothetical protein EDC30_103225 [Paucimonas lemoignei]|uniref:Uncharacterized protein n=2 Tax=Paucimonas lemoignei TaxID=29443 RepID=A0A4R3HZ19_PAULE|nr:hypothetical protein EDC30_103225 [Paucimonas lemoignei]